MDRRDFVKIIGASALTVLKTGEAEASQELSGSEYGVLVDTTLCIGCRTCETVCAEKNGLPEPPDDDAIFENVRSTSDTQFTVVNKFETDAGEVFVKKQCMHCRVPACASACLTKAMNKSKLGPVTWNIDKCMGCRFCMISCPFDIPKFEYHSATPEIKKCSMCLDKLKDGGMPECVENCPAEALTFGKRKDLLDIALTRIYNDPDSYYHGIYGDHDAGGTSFMYLSAVPFEQLGFNTNVVKTSVPELTKGFLYAVPIIFILWPAFLLSLNNATNKEPEEIF